MGYILPVQMEQYGDYHKRILRNTKDKYHIEQPFKSVLETQYEDVKNTAPDQKQKARTVHAFQSERLYAQLTGLGKNVSEKV